MKVERTRALIIFGDMTGFASWARRTPPEDFISLMERVYAVLEKLRGDERLFVKIIADGFLAVRDLKKENDHEIITDIFKTIAATSHQIEREIRRTPFPRPQGFRIRAVIGPAWKIHYGLRGAEQDYLGYYVNFCARLMGVARDRKFLASESVREAFLRMRDKEVIFKKFVYADRAPRGVDTEDLALWEVRINRKGAR